MTDPAVESAQRAMSRDPRSGVSLYDIAEIRVSSAREALAPIRAEIEELRGFYYGNTREDIEARIVLDRIAKHVYIGGDA